MFDLREKVLVQDLSTWTKGSPSRICLCNNYILPDSYLCLHVTRMPSTLKPYRSFMLVGDRRDTHTVQYILSPMSVKCIDYKDQPGSEYVDIYNRVSPIQ